MRNIVTHPVPSGSNTPKHFKTSASETESCGGGARRSTVGDRSAEGDEMVSPVACASQRGTP
eukprot:scaffold5892_cov112-Isochrysis_galbana.AAC.12